MEEKNENENDSSRRDAIRKLVAVGVVGSVAGLLLGQDIKPALAATNTFPADGNVGIGTLSPARQLHMVGSNACFRMDRNADSSAFILVRTAPGDFNTIWKTFYVGVDASGVNNGSFFIGDAGTAVSGDSTKRLIIDNSGNIIPAADNAGSIGKSGTRWADLYVTNLHQGDMIFENSYRVTEDERDGLAFKNPEGERIAVLDRKGNLQVKGKITENPNL